MLLLLALPFIVWHKSMATYLFYCLKTHFILQGNAFVNNELRKINVRCLFNEKLSTPFPFSKKVETNI